MQAMPTTNETSGNTRVQPLRALSAVKKLIADPTDTKQVFEVIQALAGSAPTRLLARMRRDADGQALLAKKPDLLLQLGDRAALEALPEDSLGRAYLAFIDREGVTADGLVEASHAGDPYGWHGREDDFGFLNKRLRDTHDLWHVLTGYGGDVLGEAALLAFSAAQTKNRGVAFIATAAVLRIADLDVAKLVLGGFVAGRHARWLPGVAFEDLLARPLAEVRRELRIVPVGPYVRRTNSWTTN